MTADLKDVVIVPTNIKISDLFKRQKNTFYREWLRKYTTNPDFIDVEKSSNSLVFRISSLTKAVTIITDDRNNFSGTFTRYVSCPDNKFDSYSKKINSKVSEKIYAILISNSVFNIPSDNEIPGWSAGFAGREVLIEKKENGIYSINEYWTPEIFPDIPEAKIINIIDKEIFELLRDYEFSEDLLLKDCEYAYNGLKGIKIQTAKSKRKSKKK